MRYTHGDTGTRLYRIWKSMKCRCLNLNHPTSKHYGRRGISICESWVNDYRSFKDWALANGYLENLELDRIDVDGNYEPSNCRWISHHEQTLNRRDTLYVEMEEKVILCADFLKSHNIPQGSFSQWRAKGIESEKLSKRIGKKVMVKNGAKDN